ncbi:hypothetical protein CC80DRAFT_443497 [Byssothecium circinans]|uniref:Spindle pole body-associated protein cut12 domain-containing protein n=1 Tax=Byssothecium circinans TaxID=147558 RepID=A0A6A5TXJ2_9PLEO|nr:hypothetical protein CC80DRAFT_443497 [Byssothecium circinans]
MFEWIMGPRMANAIEDLQPDAGYENTIIDAPETPAHQFAVKAFKHALFGTPAPEDLHAASKRRQKKQSPDALRANVPEIVPPKDSSAPASPSKQPAGIMKTPVTANKTRKSVSFGTHVVDNEGKRGNASKSGIPNNCPGKFPSPWTPGTELKVGVDSEQKPRTKLTEALLDARTTTQPKSGQKPKARDDSDITMDMGAPRSESGKYWKEQYESYAERSEKETKKLVAKQQLAKNYARKKDGEVTELITKLEGERKRYRRREHELEQKNKDYQERLRQAMAENVSASVEITALKNRIATLEKSIIIPSSDIQESKTSIRIYEDASKVAVNSPNELDVGPEVSYLSTKSRIPASGKENSPPKPRHVRRQTLQDATTRTATPFDARPRLGANEGDISTIIARSPHARRASHSTARPTPVSHQSEPSTLSVRKPEPRLENVPPVSQPKVLHSSPLPQGSPGPDLWMDNSESGIAPQDRMALPISTGGPSYARPSRPTQPSRRAPKSRAERKKVAPPTNDIFLADAKSEAPPTTARVTKKPAPIETKKEAVQPEPLKLAVKVDATKPTDYSPTDPRFNLSKITSHHAEGSAQVTKDRVELGSTTDHTDLDRKQEARRRLLERKKKKSPPS